MQIHKKVCEQREIQKFRRPRALSLSAAGFDRKSFSRDDIESNEKAINNKISHWTFQCWPALAQQLETRCKCLNFWRRLTTLWIIFMASSPSLRLFVSCFFLLKWNDTTSSSLRGEGKTLRAFKFMWKFHVIEFKFECGRSKFESSATLKYHTSANSFTSLLIVRQKSLEMFSSSRSHVMLDFQFHLLIAPPVLRWQSERDFRGWETRESWSEWMMSYADFPSANTIIIVSYDIFRAIILMNFRRLNSFSLRSFSLVSTFFLLNKKSSYHRFVWRLPNAASSEWKWVSRRFFSAWKRIAAAAAARGREEITKSCFVIT